MTGELVGSQKAQFRARPPFFLQSIPVAAEPYTTGTSSVLVSPPNSVQVTLDVCPDAFVREHSQNQNTHAHTRLKVSFRFRNSQPTVERTYLTDILMYTPPKDPTHTTHSLDMKRQVFIETGISVKFTD